MFFFFKIYPAGYYSPLFSHVVRLFLLLSVTFVLILLKKLREKGLKKKSFIADHLVLVTAFHAVLTSTNVFLSLFFSFGDVHLFKHSKQEL